MSTDRHSGSWFTEEQAMLMLTLISVLLAALVILPYVQYVLLGIVFAYILWPIRRSLSQYLRRDLNALVLTVAAIITVVIPLVYLFWRASRETLAVIASIEEGDIDIGAIEAHLADLGIEVDVAGLYEANSETIATALELAVWSVFDIVRSLPRLFIGLTITVFVLFILLRDGHQLLAWIRSIMPLPEHVQDVLNDRLDRLTRASVIGNIAASLIQAILLTIGLWLLGFTNLFFLAVLTFILALLPLVGAFLVWVPLTIYLLAIGEPVSAAILLVYGSLVSVSDFYTRPIVIGHSGAINSAIIVVGVFGGIVAFGAIGLLIGPVILGASKIAVEVLIRERNADLRAST